MQRPTFKYCLKPATESRAANRSRLKVPAAVLVLLLFLTTGAWGLQCATQAVSRTFMQLWRSDAQRSPAQWDQWFEHLYALGFTEIIVQWSSYGPVSYYPDNGKDREKSLSLPALIMAARKHHRPLWIGLHYDPNFWSAIGKETAEVAHYLDERLQFTALHLPGLLRTLEKADPRAAVLTGWYISDEIDDLNWREPVRRKALVRYLTALRQMLRQAKPTWPVLISGFSNGNTPPAQWSAFWDQLLQKTQIDGFLFQDGIGAGKLTLQSLEPYLQSFSDRFSRKASAFGVVVELFDMQQPTTSPTALRSADFKRVAAQLALARRYSTMPVTVFSASDYLVPTAGKPGKQLYLQWRADMAACRLLP